MPDGGLFVGFRNAGAALLKSEHVTTYAEPPEMAQATVRKLALAQDGTVWAATSNGLFRLEKERWLRIGKDWGFASPRAQAAFVDRSGTLWVAGDDTIVFLPRGQTRFLLTGEHIVEVDQIAQGPDGKVWMAETTHSVRKIIVHDRDAIHRQPEITVGSDAILFDDSGSLWIGTVGDGVGRLRFAKQLEGRKAIEFRRGGKVERFAERDGLSADDTSALLQDREGNIWVGTDTGLDRFRETLLVPSGLPPGSNDMILIPGDHGDLWTGSLNRAVTHIEGGSFKLQKQENGWANTCGYRDKDGTLWLGGPAGVGHLVNGVVLTVSAPPAIRRTWVTAMAGGEHGAVWASFLRDGVDRLSGGTWEHFDKQQGLPDGIPSNMYTDSKGRLWVAYLHGRVALLQGERFRTYAESDGISIGDVMTVSDQRGHLWLGGAYGLEVFEIGRFRKIEMAGGARFVGISGIVELASGDLWLNGANGILHVPASEIQHALQDPDYQATFRLFDHLDGLLGTSALLRARPTAVETTDGKIWFSVGNGVVWIDPTRSLKNTLPPPVYIKSLSANGKEFLNNPLELPVNSTNIRIDYTALSLSIPERVRFRYKLDRVDRDWQDPGDRREAFYTNLAPGPHRFQVIACNNDGVWNETGKTLDFNILPAFYQTAWFSVFCAAAAAFFIWIIYRYRLLRMTEVLDIQFQERLSERTRIAGELHDTLLQSVQGLILHFQRARNLLPNNPADAAKRLDTALERAEAAIVESRNAIHDIRSSDPIQSDLVNALRALGEELVPNDGTEGGAVLNVVVEGAARPLAPALRDEVYRIVREALRNAFTHSKGQHIETEIAYGEKLFRVRVRDDGDGIDREILAQERLGHWGLIGMRERAKRIGGRLDVWSEDNAGTEIELTIPGAIAYEASSAHNTFRLFRTKAERNP